MFYKLQRGFNLIELLIVIAIIGILVAIAVPQYQDYVTRSKWQDTLQTAASLKIGIAECVTNQGSIQSPNCANSASLSAAGYITTAAASTITSRYGAEISVEQAGTFTPTGQPVNTAVASLPMIRFDASSATELASCSLALIAYPNTGVASTFNQISWLYSTPSGATACVRNKVGVDVVGTVGT